MKKKVDLDIEIDATIEVCVAGYNGEDWDDIEFFIHTKNGRAFFTDSATLKKLEKLVIEEIDKEGLKLLSEEDEP